MTSYSAPIEPVRILDVCTANLCRSPMAEALLRRQLERAGVEAQVVSCGVQVPEPGPPVPEVVETMRGFGIELSEHRSRPLTPQLAQGAQLVIGMTREHVREAVMTDPRLLDSAFTIKELARRVSAQGFRPIDTDLMQWITALVADRDVEELLGASPLDDVADPIGGPLAGYQDTAAELSALVQHIVATVWPRSHL
jgi:protein-tyrosine phosphatase